MAELFPSMIYNEIKVDDYAKILKIEIPAIADIELETQATENGLRLKSKKRGAKPVKVHFYIEKDVLETIDELNHIFKDGGKKIHIMIALNKYNIPAIIKPILHEATSVKVLIKIRPTRPPRGVAAT